MGKTKFDSQETKEAVRELINEYVMVVDEPSRLEEWPGFFTDDGAYYVYTRENYELGLPIALAMDDTKGRILDRVQTIRDIWKGHYDEQFPLHTLSLPQVTFTDHGHCEAITAFTAVITRLGVNHYTFTGKYFDKIRLREDGTPKFVEKKVILDNAVIPTYFVYPL